MLTKQECVFCAIADGTEPAVVVHEDETTLAFMDAAPATEGHVLVVPRRHASDLLDVDLDEAAAVMQTTVRVARRIDEAFRPDGLTLFQANRPAGWQDVFHLHVHVVPRWEGDGLVRPWESGPVATLAELRRVGDRLRARPDRS